MEHTRPTPPSGPPVFEPDRELLRRQRIILGYEPCQYVDAYRVLRTRVLQKMRERGWTSLAVTSPGAKAGKTVAAVNLAISLAWEVNQSALLVDANLRGPGVHRCLGFEPKLGLSDHLLDGAAVEGMLWRLRGADRLAVLPGSRPMPNSSEMMSSPQMARLVESLKQGDASRLVVYDLPHLQTADALAFAPLVDAVLLVVESEGTGQAELAEAVEHLQGIPVVGTVLNKSRQAPAE